LRDPEAHGRDVLYGRAPLVDLVVHEQDLRFGLGIPVDPQLEILRSVMEGRVALFAMQASSLSVPTLRITTAEGPSWTVGPGDADTTVRTDLLSLFRSLHGRRTRDQVRAFAWDGDAEPFLDVWPGFVFSFPERQVEDAIA
jgi:hypothetical protein